MSCHIPFPLWTLELLTSKLSLTGLRDVERRLGMYASVNKQKSRTCSERSAARPLLGSISQIPPPEKTGISKPKRAIVRVGSHET